MAKTAIHIYLQEYSAVDAIEMNYNVASTSYSRSEKIS